MQLESEQYFKFMHKQKFIIHNLLLVIILSTGLILFYLNGGFPRNQLNISLIISILYVLWGIIFHYLKGDLHVRIVIEFALVAILAVIILRGALLR